MHTQSERHLKTAAVIFEFLMLKGILNRTAGKSFAIKNRIFKFVKEIVKEKSL